MMIRYTLYLSIFFVSFMAKSQEEILTIYYFSETGKIFDIYLKDSTVEFQTFSPKTFGDTSIVLKRSEISQEKLESTVKLIKFIENKLHRHSVIRKKINRTNPSGYWNKDNPKQSSYFNFSRVIKTPKYIYITNENQTNKKFVFSGFPWTWYSSWRIIKLYEKSQIEVIKVLKENSLYY